MAKYTTLGKCVSGIFDFGNQFRLHNTHHIQVLIDIVHRTDTEVLATIKIDFYSFVELDNTLFFYQIS
ncbi:MULTISPECIES: hypothetical protein [Calothrix]|uniref:Uncharacterized protein n=2 Tax=Calothrix TaxID=1186 RepID=A0ABR8A4W4_9CYAN|nr:MULTISPECIES: hypothetical protein [Calothrix]MBD2194987.1 hypothetical protein [Calothrix parietina FACHB-288]MBD2223585.1 hypothetical protein [Calothrix anomala FACHB-343]